MARLALTAALATAAAFATASGTGLNYVPTAEVVGRGYAVRNFDVYSEPNAPNYRAAGALFGIGERAELGFDSGSDGSTIWNAKLNLLEGRNSAFAIGVCDWERDTLSKYAVGRMDFTGFRLHAGYLYDGIDRPFAGLDFDAAGITWMIDHVGGSDAKTWFGSYYEFNDEVAISLGASLPKGEGNTSGWYASFTWTTGG